MSGDFKGESLSEPADSPLGGGVVGKQGEGAIGYNAKGGFNLIDLKPQTRKQRLPHLAAPINFPLVPCLIICFAAT